MSDSSNAQVCKNEDPYFTAKRDSGKLRFDLVPVAEMEALADIFTFGAEKYGPNTWPNVPDAIERYYAAALRHLVAWRKGTKTDPESGRPHLAHAFWNLGALLMLDEGSVEPKTKGL